MAEPTNTPTPGERAFAAHLADLPHRDVAPAGVVDVVYASPEAGEDR